MRMIERDSDVVPLFCVQSCFITVIGQWKEAYCRHSPSRPVGLVWFGFGLGVPGHHQFGYLNTKPTSTVRCGSRAVTGEFALCECRPLGEEERTPEAEDSILSWLLTERFLLIPLVSEVGCRVTRLAPPTGTIG